MVMHGGVHMCTTIITHGHTADRETSFLFSTLLVVWSHLFLPCGWKEGRVASLARFSLVRFECAHRHDIMTLTGVTFPAEFLDIDDFECKIV